MAEFADLTKKGWYHLRTPLKAYHRVENGHLLLKCGPHALSQDEAVAMLLQKQTTFNGVWRVEFAFSPVQMGEEAGIAVWWSKWAYCSVSIRGGKNKAELVFRKPAEHGDGFEESVWDAPSGTVTIEIKAEPSRYSFYLLSAGARTPLGMMSAHLLVRTRPWDSKFTGTFLGLFAQGYGGFGTNNLARFKSVEWQGVLGED